MIYTIKKLSEMAGVSVRTLHWYDAIGLLEPSFCNEKGYRFYEENHLFTLQQILFFKELGFSLRDIKTLLLQDTFDNLSALSHHKKMLENDILRKQTMIKTIDKTIQHLKGTQAMKNKELYEGFDLKRQKEYDEHIVHYYGTTAEDRLFQSKKRTAKWDKTQWDDVKNKGDEIHKALTLLIEKESEPNSQEVQEIIHRHYDLQNRFFAVTQEVYIGLSDLYAQHPDFKKFFEAYHPKMIEFIGKAMRHYAYTNLD